MVLFHPNRGESKLVLLVKGSVLLPKKEMKSVHLTAETKIAFAYP